MSNYSIKSTIPPDTVGVIFAVLGAVMFSAKGILIKFVYDDGMSTIAVMSLRMAFSLPIFMGIAWLAYQNHQTKLTRNDYGQIILCGILSYYVATWLSFYGLHYISVQLERLILFSYPSLVIIGIAFINKSMPNKRICAAAVLTYLGVILVFGHDFKAGSSGVDGNDSSLIALGTVLVALSALSFAIYVILSKRLIQKMGSAFFTGTTMSVSAIAIFIHAIVSFANSGVNAGFHTSPKSYGLVAIIGIFGTVIPALMLNEAVARIGPSRTAILGTTGPIATSALAVYFLGEPFTVFHLIALIFCIVGASFIVQSKG